MAKPTSFSRTAKPAKSGSTSFAFGANAPNFTTTAPVVGARGSAKKGSARKAQSASGGGS